MKVVLKPIFEWLVGGYTLFDNVLYNYIAMAIVGLIAFTIAWNIVGSLYRDHLISGSAIGSILHWTIRFIVFIILFTVVSVVFRVIKIILIIPLWIWAIVIFLFIAGYIMFFVIRKNAN